MSLNPKVSYVKNQFINLWIQIRIIWVSLESNTIAHNWSRGMEIPLRGRLWIWRLVYYYQNSSEIQTWTISTFTAFRGKPWIWKFVTDLFENKDRGIFESLRYSMEFMNTSHSWFNFWKEVRPKKILQVIYFAWRLFLKQWLDLENSRGQTSWLSQIKPCALRRYRYGTFWMTKHQRRADANTKFCQCCMSFLFHNVSNLETHNIVVKIVRNSLTFKATSYCSQKWKVLCACTTHRGEINALKIRLWGLSLQNILKT